MLDVCVYMCVFEGTSRSSKAFKGTLRRLDDFEQAGGGGRKETTG